MIEVLPLSFGLGCTVQRWVLSGKLGKDLRRHLRAVIVIQNALLELFAAGS